MDLSFNYVEEGNQSVTTSWRKGSRKQASPVTQQMLHERTAQLEAEQDSSGQPSIWRNVYNLLRCPGPPCNLRPHCWRDPVGKRRYKLKTHHLRLAFHSYHLEIASETGIVAAKGTKRFACIDDGSKK